MKKEKIEGQILRIGKPKTTLQINKTKIGDSIEIQMEGILNGNSIPAGEEKENMTYTNLGDGVIPITNIRSDRFEMALEETMKATEHQEKRWAKKAEEREEEVKKLHEKESPNQEGGESVNAAPNNPE